MYSERIDLTPRQTEILLLVAEGLTYRGIGQRLKISNQTVKNHLTQIYTQLGALNNCDAVARALRRGLIE